MENDQTENKLEEPLNLNDLLIDEQADGLSDYLSLSIENLGVDTRVSVSTVEETPLTYSSILSGVSFTDLHNLMDVNIDSVSE